MTMMFMMMMITLTKIMMMILTKIMMMIIMMCTYFRSGCCEVLSTQQGLIAS